MSCLRAPLPRLLGLAVAIATLSLAGCDGPPREASIQWVARDAWDPTCAEKAMVETWKVTNPRWTIPKQVYAVDVDAKFRLTDQCASGLPLVGKSYRSLDVVPFAGTVELSRCKKNDEEGWSLPGKESSRCWTGPKLVQ